MKTKESATKINTRSFEVNYIAYNIPGISGTILCRLSDGRYVVETPDGTMLYTQSEVIEIYGIDPTTFERLGWVA